jgi:hypothetical protein
VRCLSEAWRHDYNTERPHKSLGYHSPHSYARAYERQVALSTPASETSKQIEATPVVDNAVESKPEFIFETLTDTGTKKGGADSMRYRWAKNK